MLNLALDFETLVKDNPSWTHFNSLYGIGYHVVLSLSSLVCSLPLDVNRNHPKAMELQQRSVATNLHTSAWYLFLKNSPNKKALSNSCWTRCVFERSWPLFFGTEPVYFYSPPFCEFWLQSYADYMICEDLHYQAAESLPGCHEVSWARRAERFL